MIEWAMLALVLAVFWRLDGICTVKYMKWACSAHWGALD
jgi:hypothetical protein